MPNTGDESEIEQLVEEVLKGAKYRHISPDLVKRLGARELAKRQSVKEAIKATRNKLHQVGGAYLDGRERYAEWLQELQRVARLGDKASLRACCNDIMSNHASTRERLGVLEAFYSTLFAEVGPIHRVLDIACGLNPLAIPWMSFGDDVEYYAYDIYQHMMDFLNAALPLLHVRGRAHVCDVIQSCPEQQVDVALVLKAIPCLEQVDKQAGAVLLRALNARAIIVSFPVQSLGGRGKGMARYYEQHFNELLKEEPWQVQRYQFATELAFIVRK